MANQPVQGVVAIAAHQAVIALCPRQYLICQYRVVADSGAGIFPLYHLETGCRIGALQLDFAAVGSIVDGQHTATRGGVADIADGCVANVGQLELISCVEARDSAGEVGGMCQP
ncbi:hypothetical protein D3C80_812720 [compost metagenome]